MVSTVVRCGGATGRLSVWAMRTSDDRRKLFSRRVSRSPGTTASRSRRRRSGRWAAVACLTAIVVGQPVSSAYAVGADRDDRGTAVVAAADRANPYAAAVIALVGERPADAVTALPPDFAANLGYVPDLVAGYPIDPEGDCSSPVPLPDVFTPLCRTHDFGYDLLRAAATIDRPLGPWARTALDRMLITRMDEACEGTPCRVAAQAARVGLGWNTWRQHGGPPTAGESVPALIATTVSRVFTDAREVEVRS